MSIEVQCACGRRLRAKLAFAGTRAECPSCGQVVQIPNTPSETTANASESAFVGSDAPSAAEYAPEEKAETKSTARESRPRQHDAAEPMDVVDFLDPPSQTPPMSPPPGSPVLQRMFDALLDPRSIHWMLTFGGGLAVIGIVIWLYSTGIFENKYFAASALGVGTLAILGSGWFVALRTRYQVAGEALTFFGCVVAPLNLWFYHAQGIATLDDRLWIGGMVCSLIYIATVVVLRNPLFLYAVEAGVTLTGVLFLADLQRLSDATWLTVFLTTLGLLSIHAERAFAAESTAFPRARFGLPLFWSGHAQLCCALIMLLSTQLLGWFPPPTQLLFGTEPIVTLLNTSSLLSCSLWLAGFYAYLYSDIVVRRVGVYTVVAAFCLVMAEITLIGDQLPIEMLIAILAVTAAAANLAQSVVSTKQDRIARIGQPLAFALSSIPLLMGIGLHIRSTSPFVREILNWGYPSNWELVGAMFVVAVSNRLSAFVFRTTAPRWSAAYFFFSAAGVVVAAAGTLRVGFGVEHWSEQAPWLILIPIGYIISARLWRGRTPEKPLGLVAHATTAVILLHVLAGSLESGEWWLKPVAEARENLLLALVFVEATLFYMLAAIFRRRSANAYFAAAAATGAIWQFMIYFGVEDAYWTMAFAVLGLGMLLISRLLGLELVPVYRHDHEARLTVRGRGLPAFQSGNAILLIALLAAFLQGLGILARGGTDWTELSVLSLTTLCGLVAIPLVPGSEWRRVYVTSTIALGGLTFLTLNVLIDLSGWQKLEIFCVVTGLLMLISSHIGRFQEGDRSFNETVSVGLLFGSLLTPIPLFVAVLYHRFFGDGPSMVDEFALLTVTILMVVTGSSWKTRATTLLGGGTLGVYLMILIGSIAYRPQVAVGVYLAVGGAVVFGSGILLSVYRERLLRLPEQIANREGIFQVLDWR